ncbi:MAG: hypothetical protein AAGT88_00585 [Dethiobacter sp.]
MDKAEKLQELRAKLEELMKSNPAICPGAESVIGRTEHSMSPELFQEIEALEKEIKKLEQELKSS